MAPRNNNVQAPQPRLDLVYYVHSSDAPNLVTVSSKLGRSKYAE